jgi:hypothetical protein
MSDNQENSFDLADKYGEKYSRYSDAEIISILKKRDQYQPEAAKTAINEAVKRGIIYSDQDLLGEEFRTGKQDFTLFPVPEKDYGIKKLTNSILRILIIVGIIPLIHGFMKLRIYETNEGILMIVSGLIWITLSWLLHKTRKSIIAWIMLIIVFCSIGYTINQFAGKDFFKSMDIFVSGFVNLMLIYLVLYFRKLVLKR